MIAYVYLLEELADLYRVQLYRASNGDLLWDYVQSLALGSPSLRFPDGELIPRPSRENVRIETRPTQGPPGAKEPVTARGKLRDRRTRMSGPTLIISDRRRFACGDWEIEAGEEGWHFTRWSGDSHALTQRSVADLMDLAIVATTADRWVRDKGWRPGSLSPGT